MARPTLIWRDPQWRRQRRRLRALRKVVLLLLALLVFGAAALVHRIVREFDSDQARFDVQTLAPYETDYASAHHGHYGTLAQLGFSQPDQGYHIEVRPRNRSGYVVLATPIPPTGIARLFMFLLREGPPATYYSDEAGGVCWTSQEVHTWPADAHGSLPGPGWQA